MAVSVARGPTSSSTFSGSDSSVRAASAKRTVARRWPDQYPGSIAWDSVIHVPVTVETKGARGAESRTPRSKAANRSTTPKRSPSTGRGASGERIGPYSMIVAHKTLPCGARVTLRRGDRVIRVRVVDRGPYVGGREFDLTSATRAKLHFGGVGSLLVAS